MNELDTNITNKSIRLAKNTLYLYLRMLMMTLISLYTSRVILEELGIKDYGTYSVVGGVILMFSFLHGPITTANQRFINYAIGKKDEKSLKQIFTSSIILLAIIGLIIVILGETIGLWFINTHMNIAANRMVAANWVFQLSIAAFYVNLLSIPYTAVIIAHEKMSAFAVISIIETILKLLAAMSLTLWHGDKLIFYAVLIFLIGLFIRLVYQCYCNRNFLESKVRLSYVSKEKMKSMLSFSCWSLLGGIRKVCHTQGIAIVINMYFGVAVNAAQGVSNQVNAVVSQFVSNFLMATNPQIVQSYASGELKQMHNLIFWACKIAITLCFIPILPLCLETPTVLSIWLKEVPEYAIIFVRAILFTSLCESFSTVMQISMGATGNIKNYQISLSIVGLLHLPLAWTAFYYGYDAYYSMYIYIILAIILQMIRIWFVCNAVGINIMDFYKRVISRGVLFMVSAVFLPLMFHIYSNSFHAVFQLVIVTIVSFVASPLSFYYIYCDKNERIKFRNLINSIINKYGINRAIKKR